MNDLRTAAQQALEAMEKNTKHLPMHFDNYFEAMHTLRAALAEPVQEPLSVDIVDTLDALRDERHPMFVEGYDYAVHVVQCVIAKREGRAQP